MCLWFFESSYRSNHELHYCSVTPVSINKYRVQDKDVFDLRVFAWHICQERGYGMGLGVPLVKVSSAEGFF
jgi:hypothetical protein